VVDVCTLLFVCLTLLDMKTLTVLCATCGFVYVCAASYCPLLLLLLFFFSSERGHTRFTDTANIDYTPSVDTFLLRTKIRDKRINDKNKTNTNTNKQKKRRQCSKLLLYNTGRDFKSEHE
jgi:hypothetical protein